MARLIVSLWILSILATSVTPAARLDFCLYSLYSSVTFSLSSNDHASTRFAGRLIFRILWRRLLIKKNLRWGLVGLFRYRSAIYQTHCLSLLKLCVRT